jgi:hypothetical protein
MIMKLRLYILAGSAVFSFLVISPGQSPAQKPKITPPPGERHVNPEGLTNEFITAIFKAVWHHDITSIEMGAPAVLENAAKVFQVPKDTPMFPVHAQDATGWRHATYFYRDPAQGQWHSTLDLVPIDQ